MRDKDESYWRQGVLNRHLALESSLSTAWARELLSGFIEYQVGRVPAKRLALALADHVRRLQLLERRFGALEEINAEQLLARYTPEEMRRSQSLFDYLHSVGVGTPSRDQREVLAEDRRIAAQLERIRYSPHAPLLRRFHAALGRENTRGVVPQKRSQRSSLAAACGWLALAGDNTLTQDSLERYLRKTPGQRAALSTFVGFLGREEDIGLRLPAKSNRKTSRVTQREGDDALARCLEVLGDEAGDFANRRAALAGTFLGLLGMPLRVVVRFARDTIVEARENGLKLVLPAAGVGEVNLDTRLVAAIAIYLGERDQLVGRSDGFLLPGRPLHQHVSECTVAARLKVLGAPVQVLSATSGNWIKQRAALFARSRDERR